MDQGGGKGRLAGRGIEPVQEFTLGCQQGPQRIAVYLVGAGKGCGFRPEGIGHAPGTVGAGPDSEHHQADQGGEHQGRRFVPMAGTVDDD